MANVLIIAPQNVGDIPTLISAEAALQLSQWAKDRGHEVIQLFAIQTERFFLWLVTSLRKEIDIVIYFGHGGENEWYGNNFLFPMLTTAEAQWMAGKICAPRRFCPSSCTFPNWAAVLRCGTAAPACT